VVGEEVTRAILPLNNRVIGVVINAIDDRLSSAQQTRDDWSINRISPLGPLLKLARDSRRVVVLVSDHGHVWHCPDARLLEGEAGTRWRPKIDSVQDGEIVIAGSRVREGSGQNAVVVPWVETIYYGRQQNGYHGGATPQKMVRAGFLLRSPIFLVTPSLPTVAVTLGSCRTAEDQAFAGERQGEPLHLRDGTRGLTIEGVVVQARQAVAAKPDRLAGVEMRTKGSPPNRSFTRFSSPNSCWPCGKASKGAPTWISSVNRSAGC
jgi:hypothetical protein